MGESDPNFFVGIMKISELESLFTGNWRIQHIPTHILSKPEQLEFSRYGYKCRFPIFITGDTEARARNILLVNGNRVTIGDTAFTLFLRLVVQLLKNKHGVISRRKLINCGYINADGEFQSVSRLRQVFNGALGSLSPQEFIETCQNKSIRLSIHPALVSYNKEKLLCHHDQRIRKLTRRLP